MIRVNLQLTNFPARKLENYSRFSADQINLLPWRSRERIASQNRYVPAMFRAVITASEIRGMPNIAFIDGEIAFPAR